MEGQSSNDDSGRKRKRTSSGSVSLTSSYISNNLNHYGETILNCTVHISKGIKECGNDIVPKYTCALLNSGGGILHMRNLDHEHRVQSKDLDTWWGGMENKLVDIISGDDICNYFDMIGNYDDQDLYLFVKSAEHICTIDYHSRLPTDTATHEVSYQSVIKLLRKQGQCHSLSDLPPIPDIFIYGKTCESLKQETKQIQFKQFSASTNKDSKSLPDRIKYTVCKYISAFANHEGGHIYFGIDDTRAAVYGEELSVADQDRTVKLVQNRMNLMIWGDSQFKAEMGVHWDIKFCPVEQCSKKKGRRVVVIISVCKFPGGVFTACPDSYFISEDGSVQSWTFHQWKLSMLNQFRDKPELHNRFERLPLTVPQAPLVYTLKHTLDKITAKLLNEHTSCKPQPPHFLETVTALEERVIIQKFLEHFHGDRHISIFVNCWGMGIMTPLPDEVICDILILSETQGCHLLTFSHKDLPHVWQHTQSVAANIKFKLVSLGGCIDKFGIICHLINLNDKDDLFASLLLENFYPSHYSISSIRLDNILQAMIIAMSAYTPVDFTTLADSKRETILSSDIYFFLLTCDQFELLWSQQYTKELWVHSPPGGGKTVAAVQFILELRRRGCSKTNVLYIAENEMLCSYVGFVIKVNLEQIKSVELDKMKEKIYSIFTIYECDLELPTQNFL